MLRTLPMSPREKRRQILGASLVAVLAATLALAAVLELVGIEVAAGGIVALVMIAAASYALATTGFGSRYAEGNVVCAQLAAMLLVLAWLEYRTADALGVLPGMYLLVMLYAAMQLDRTRLVLAGGFALITYGVALFMLIDDGRARNLPVLWLQFGAFAFSLAWVGMIARTVLRLRQRLADARAALYELGKEADQRAGRDPLTGIYHHRHLMDALEREIARAERVGKPLSVARVDLDWLGSINQAHGPAAGDVALKRFTAAAAGALRDVDIFGRYGGKEFLIVMPDTDGKGAIVAAERVRLAVAREPVPEVAGRRNLACTLGVAEHRQSDNTRQVISRAEAGLIYAKAAGRDRVVALDAAGKPILVEAG
jgi:diguanylate cyclase (GGDEF)-like protein